MRNYDWGYATLKKMGVEENGVREWHYSGLLTSTQNGASLVLLKKPSNFICDDQDSSQ